VSTNQLTVRAGIAALLTVAWGLALMFVPSKYPFPHRFHHDVDSAILALEISRGADDIERVIRPGPDEQAEVKDCFLGTKDVRTRTAMLCEAQARDYEYKSNQFDLVFIPLYCFSLWSLARVFMPRTPLLTLLILGAALFDYLEDWQIFRALDGANPTIYIPSLIKWGLLALAFLGIGIVLPRSKSPVYALATKRLVGIAYFLSGLLLLISVALGTWMGYSLIELASGVFAFLLVVQVTGFLGPYLAIPGIKQTFVANFCEERKKAGQESLTAVKAEPADGSRL
jgi:hypothetical protein